MGCNAVSLPGAHGQKPPARRDDVALLTEFPDRASKKGGGLTLELIQ